MPTVYPLHYAPNIDTNWSVNPGACTDMSYLVQMQDGTLCGTTVTSALGGFSLTGSDHLHAEVFPQISGTSRFLTFRVQNIDEYTSGGSRTNRGTAYNASTTSWNAAAWGNQIIAVNYLDAPQSSTGAGFTALSGTPPKARYIASNVNFVMMADVDDGGSNVYADMVWWGGIRNPNTWTPSQATQAGNVRLLDIPGPIKNIVSFGDKFIVFKENAIFVGKYIGPPYVFGWQVISYNIGLSYSKAVTEVDGKLFFIHHSGVYSFDGERIQNIGIPMWAPLEIYSTADKIMLRGDEIQGNVFLGCHSQYVDAGTYYQLYTYSYNARTGLWARQGSICTSVGGSPEPIFVVGSSSEYRAFSASWGVRTGFAWIDNATSAKVAVLVGGMVTADNAATVTTGKIGNNEDVSKVTRVYPRLTISSSNSINAATVSGFHDERDSAADTTATPVWNALTTTLDCTLTARYKTIAITFSTLKSIKISGLGLDGFPAGKR